MAMIYYHIYYHSIIHMHFQKNFPILQSEYFAIILV